MKQLKSISFLVLCLSIIFFLFFEFTKHAPGLGDINPFAEDPFDAVGSFGIQLAFVSSILMVLRAFRPYHQPEVSPGQITLLFRSGVITLVTVAVTLAGDVIGMTRKIFTQGFFPGATPLTALLISMLVIVFAVAWIFIHVSRHLKVTLPPRPWNRLIIVSALAILILAIYPSEWRNSSITGGIFTALAGMVILFISVWVLATSIFPAMEKDYEDIFQDLATIFLEWKKRSRLINSAFTMIHKLTSFPPAKRFLEWINPRCHRWNLVIILSLAMGFLLVVVEMLAEGVSPNVGRAFLVVGVYISLESAGVLLGYFLLGKYLGIFRSE